MSDEATDVTGLIDAALDRTISETTEAELRAFRKQAEAGTLQDDDRKYVEAACRRLLALAETSKRLAVDKDNEEREAANQTRIDRHRQAANFFESSDDLRWLHFDLALRDPLEKWRIENELRDVVLYPDDTESVARYIDRPMIHCTTLRDFLIARLIESLTKQVQDPIKLASYVTVRTCVVVFLVLLTLALYRFINWWAAAAVLVVLFGKGLSWLKELDNKAKCEVLNRCTREKLHGIIATVKRGGFDEPTIIRQLESFDLAIPPPPGIVKIYGRYHFLGSDPSGIQEHSIQVPDVLYALLRLPRRNVENEIWKSFSPLSAKKKEQLHWQWREFVVATYGEPHARRCTVMEP